MDKKNIFKAIVYLLGALATAAGILFGLSACNVTRIITTESQAYQKGDTSVTIISRTTETYDASRQTKP